MNATHQRRAERGSLGPPAWNLLAAAEVVLLALGCCLAARAARAQGCTYTVAATAGTGGTISPSGLVSASCGTTQSFSITPNDCYEIADVKVDQVSIGATASYAFNGVNAALYKRLVTSYGKVTINDDVGDGISRDHTVTMGGRVWQNYADTTLWTDHAASWIRGTRIGGVELPGVPQFVTEHLAAPFTPMTPPRTSGAGSVTFTFSNPVGEVAYFKVDPSWPEANHQAGYGDFYTFRSISDVKIKVNGHCVWVVPQGIRFENLVTVDRMPGALDASLVIVSPPNGRDNVFGSYAHVGIWLFGGLNSASVPVTLVSDGGVHVEQFYNSNSETYVDQLSIFAGSLFMTGPHVGHHMQLNHGSAMDDVIDWYALHNALPNTSAGGDHTIEASFRRITLPSVRVMFPNGGENMLVGEPTTLTWTASDECCPIPTVDLYESRDHGLTFTPIALEVPNTGNYAWTAPPPGTNTSATPAYSALLQVVAMGCDGEVIADQSDAAFSIFDLATSTQAASLSAARTPSGARLSWTLPMPERWLRLTIERAEHEVGPWTFVDGVTPRGQGTWEDRSVRLDREYFYRLSGVSEAEGVRTLSDAHVLASQFVFGLVAYGTSLPRGSVKLALSLPAEQNATVAVLDVQGRRVASLVDGPIAAGIHELTWGADADPGIYFVRASAGKATRIVRIAIVR